MAAKKSKTKKTSKQRASWRGHLSFGLVSFPVQAINALNRQQSDIHFHQLHAGCHRRIHYQKVCPVHGEVSNDEIVSGYEYRKGKYIEIDPEELDAVRTKKERSLSIDAFVDSSTIDPLYFDGRMYYLVPDGPAATEPYGIIAQAIHEAALGLYFGAYNFVCRHSKIKTTPAVAAGIADAQWSVERLIDQTADYNPPEPPTALDKF